MGDLQTVAIVVGVASVSAFVTWITAHLIGRRISARHPRLGRCVTILVAPAVTLASGAVRFGIDAAAHPQSDWPAMGMTGMIVFALIMLPVATVTARWALRT